MDAISPEDALLAAGATFAIESEAPEYSDDAIALAFSDRYKRDLLHVPEWGVWLRWDGARWARDKTLAVFDLARAICREHAAEAEATAKTSGTWIGKIASAQKVAAVERLARSDRRHARAAEQFDADPWVLNTPNGVVDLQNGDLRPHRRGDLFTKVTAQTPSGACPRWLQFLHEIVQGDEAVIAYLQRWVGYMLTGIIREHAFLFLCGPGGNGKSVLLNTIAAVMGDYATSANMDLFTLTRGEQHPTGLASLRGARLVTAQETEAGQVLAEARLKAMTGGDRIKARFMGRDFFEYDPVFKVAMAGNHRPVIRNPDDAMRRRLHLLPLVYKPAVPDLNLPDRLLEEAPGILAWAVEGCALWQRDGLGMPAVVKEATADYFAEQDSIAQWLAERCEAKPGVDTASSALFRDWTGWARNRGEEPGTIKAFSATLEKHHAKRKTKTTINFLSVRLKPSDGGVW